jgi:hypothetical protein
MMTNLSPTSKSLDFRVMLITPLREFMGWLIAVLIVSIAGYPGVVCVTPMAWLIALRVGNNCVSRSRSEQSRQRILEASIAGAILGLLQGILFLVIVPFMGPYASDEITKTLVLTLVMILVGMVACAGLAFFTAYLKEQRNNRTQ